MIDFFNFQKSYGTHKVLDIPELTIKTGIHWIRGVNGSGKTTLLKSITGIIPFDGDIIINDINLKRHPILSRRQVGYCEAEPVYPVFLSASDIVGFIAYVRDIKRWEVDKMVKFFGFDHYMEQATGGYSTGMLKKLALCIAFLGNLPWILLDEPFAFIDRETEEKVYDMINQKSNEGISLIISSHHELKNEAIRPDNTYLIRDTQLIKV